MMVATFVFIGKRIHSGAATIRTEKERRCVYNKVYLGNVMVVHYPSADVIWHRQTCQFRRGKSTFFFLFLGRQELSRSPDFSCLSITIGQIWRLMTHRHTPHMRICLPKRFLPLKNPSWEGGIAYINPPPGALLPLTLLRRGVSATLTPPGSDVYPPWRSPRSLRPRPAARRHPDRGARLPP